MYRHLMRRRHEAGQLPHRPTRPFTQGSPCTLTPGPWGPDDVWPGDWSWIAVGIPHEGPVRPEAIVTAGRPTTGPGSWRCCKILARGYRRRGKDSRKQTGEGTLSRSADRRGARLCAKAAEKKWPLLGLAGQTGDHRSQVPQKRGLIDNLLDAGCEGDRLVSRGEIFRRQHHRQVGSYLRQGTRHLQT